MKIKFTEREVFYLKNFLLQLRVEDLGEVDGNKFKAITMRRKVVDKLGEDNDNYEAKVKTTVETQEKYAKEVKEFTDECNKRIAAESDEEKKKKLTEDSIKEVREFSLESDKDFGKELEGKKIILRAFNYKGKDKPQTFLIVDGDKEISIELEDAQADFVKRLFEKQAPEETYYQAFEDEMLKVAKSLGIEV